MQKVIQNFVRHAMSADRLNLKLLGDYGFCKKKLLYHIFHETLTWHQHNFWLIFTYVRIYLFIYYRYLLQPRVDKITVANCLCAI